MDTNWTALFSQDAVPMGKRKVLLSTVSDFRVGDLKENWSECATAVSGAPLKALVQLYHYITN